jgi:hypothetical protein
MNSRIVSLVFVFACTALPVHAQPTLRSLAREVRALTARVTTLENDVAKLNGQITADELVGTYTVTSFETEMSVGLMTTPGPSFGLNVAPSTGVSVFVGTATLAADGTLSLSLTQTGNTLAYDTIVQGVPAWNLVPGSHSGVETGTWTYANGTVTFGGASLSVAAGGRLLIFANSSNPNPSHGNSQLVILTRLQ